MKIKILTVLLVVSLAFNLGILVKVIFKPTPAGHVQEAVCIQWKDSHICHRLKLNPQQVQQMETYREQFQKQISPLQSELEKERSKLFQVLKQDTLVQGEAEEVLQQISHLQTEIQKNFIRHFFQIKTIFDKDQQQQFYSYLGQCLCIKHTEVPCGENSCSGHQGHKEDKKE